MVLREYPLPVPSLELCGIRYRVGDRRGRTARDAAAVTGGAYRGAMPPLPRCTGREVVRALMKLGWMVVAQRGSHVQLRHPTRGGRVTVPVHAGETLGLGLLRSILSQAGVTVDELRSRL